MTSSKTSSAPDASDSARRRLEEAGLRRDDAHVPRNGLHENAGETLAVALDGGGRGHEVVVRRDDSVRRNAGRHAGAGGDPERGDTGARVREQRVDVAVVVAGETEDAVPVA